jgi:MOSC domain-containing protein YiiM
MGEPNWVNRFADARRPGLYVRVLEAGETAAGDPVERLGGGEGNPTVVELMDAWYDPEPDADLLERLLAAPVAVRDRASLEKKLARALAAEAS